MSFSVDDLVASLNSNHIGQEQLDLAALQAELAQTLVCHTASSMDVYSGHQRGYPPSNTPTSRTPSSSFSWDRSEFSRKRNSSLASTRGRSVSEEHRGEREPDVEEMDEDERMVEDLLCPSSPMSASATITHFHHPVPPTSPASPSYPTTSRKYNSPSSSYTPNHVEYPPTNTSLFTTTDPFYLAQLQASQKPTPSSSYFAHTGRPSQQSSFVLAQPMPSQGHTFAHRMTTYPEVEPHNMFFVAA